MTATHEPICIIAALAEALPKLEGAKKTKANPAFKSKYADLSSVIDALEPLKDHGLWFLQISHERDNGACFETMVIHGPTGAQLSMGTVFVPADRNNAQGFGSAQTYARRYGLLAAFGLATEDDDGNAAAAAPPRPTEKREPQHSALKQQVRAFVHELNGCGDGDEMSAFLATPDAIKLIKDVREKLPGWWEGWPEQPDGFVPLADLITRRQRECAHATANYLTA